MGGGSRDFPSLESSQPILDLRFEILDLLTDESGSLNKSQKFLTLHDRSTWHGIRFWAGQERFFLTTILIIL